MVEQLFHLKGKTIVITGASRGIGKALAGGLLALGGNVVLSGNNQIETDSTARELDLSGKQTLAVQCDVTQRTDCERLIFKTIERFQNLDVMICNAGIGMIKPADSLSDDDWDQIVDTNLKGCFNAAVAAMKWLRAHKRPGSIVMISSIAGSVGIARMAPYAASKGGINQLVKSLAVEWGPYGIRVNAIAPGYIKHLMSGLTTDDEPMSEVKIKRSTPLARRAELSELVGPVAFLCSEASSYITGVIMPVDGGYTAQ